MPWSAIASGFARESATVSASPGQPGAIAAYPASSKSSTQGCHEVACSQRPWMKTTGRRVSVMGCSSIWGRMERSWRVRQAVGLSHLAVVDRVGGPGTAQSSDASRERGAGPSVLVMDLQLDGQTVVVTGAGRGIG